MPDRFPRPQGTGSGPRPTLDGEDDAPPLTLIHGIGGRPGHVLPLAEAFGAGGERSEAGAAHHVAAPTLPGHAHDDAAPVPAGGSPLPGVAAGGLPTNVAGAAAWLAARTPVAGRLLIGHSTGGVLALALAGTAAPGQAPAGVAVVDSNVPVAPDAVAARAAKDQLARRPDWRAAMRASLARDWRGPEPGRDRVFADLDATPDEPMRSPWESVLTADPRALWAALPPVPVLYLRATRAVAREDLDAVLPPGTDVTVTDLGADAGHWPHLQDPAATTAAIRAWWAGRGR